MLFIYAKTEDTDEFSVGCLQHFWDHKYDKAYHIRGYELLSLYRSFFDEFQITNSSLDR